MKNNATILIVDDVASNIELLGSILKNDYDIKVALNGKKAIDIALIEPYPDLILLDVEMPDMNGYQVLEKLQTHLATKFIPIIFVTGSDSIEEEEKGLLLGAVDYITKPIRPIIVKARIQTHLTIKFQRDELVYQSSHDQLTGLYNRHQLAQEGNRKFSKARRQKEDFCVVILDIDHFKNVNDTYGHLIGDEILKAVAKVLEQNKRIEDFTARYGGEEFILLLDNCNLEDAKFKANILRLRVQNLMAENIKISASFGVAQLDIDKHKKFEELIKDADLQLYKAKESGRNKVCG